MVPGDTTTQARIRDSAQRSGESFNEGLLNKHRILAVTKSDLLDEELMEMLREDLPDDLPVIFISAVAGHNITELKDLLWTELNSESNKLQSVAEGGSIVHRDREVEYLDRDFADWADDVVEIDDDDIEELERLRNRRRRRLIKSSYPLPNRSYPSPHSTGKSRGFPVFLYPPACFFSKRPHRFSHMELLDYTLAPEVRTFSTPRTALSPAIETDAPYAGFNLTDYCGDNPTHVAECREALCAALKISDNQLLLPHQTHTNRVALVDEALMEMESSERYAHLQNVDALVTALPRVCIGISTADCVPVLLYDPQNHIIGAAHAGWRGIVGHILAHTIERMRTLGTNPRDLRAVVGPCIGPDSFEVGEEVVDAFLQAKFSAKRRATWFLQAPAHRPLGSSRART